MEADDRKLVSRIISEMLRAGKEMLLSVWNEGWCLDDIRGAISVEEVFG